MNGVMLDRFFLRIQRARQNVVYKGEISLSVDSYPHTLITVSIQLLRLQTCTVVVTDNMAEAMGNMAVEWEK